MQLILIIYGFCIYEFAYWIKFTCNPQINTHGIFADMSRARKYLSHPVPS